MKRVAKIDKSVAYRRQFLGDIGEELAQGVLERNGFTNIRHISRAKKNSRYADFVAERNGVRYAISVKTRNKFVWRREPGARPTLNDRYKLGRRCYELAALAEREHAAQAAWLTISMDRHSYNAYFGLLAALNGNKAVLMSEAATAGYDRLAIDEPHSYDHRRFENAYDEVDRDQRASGDFAARDASVGASFRRHPDADARIASARRAMAAILELDLYPRHKHELLSICLWKLSEAEASAKYATRFRSVDALATIDRLLAHDHVFERRKLIDRLLADPDCVDEVVKLSIGCTVTRAEHRMLTLVSQRHPELDGWERYREAGVQVVDTLTGECLAHVYT